MYVIDSITDWAKVPTRTVNEPTNWNVYLVRVDYSFLLFLQVSTGLVVTVLNNRISKPEGIPTQKTGNPESRQRGRVDVVPRGSNFGPYRHVTVEDP